MPVNRITPSNANRTRVILATAFVIISSSWATADSLYRFTSLGTDFFPYRISASGQVVGAGEYGRNPALMWQDGVVRNLGAGAAHAINSAGQILLSSPRPGDGRNSPHLWQNGATTPLPIPPWNSDFRHYYDMNASGHVVGQALDRAFLWADDRLMYLDSAFAGQQSSAYAINDAGKVVGRANTGFLWDQGKVTLLPDTAMDINNRDQVLLFSSLWESGVQTPITLLPRLPGSDPEMISFRAEAINDRGQVVARQRENYLISIEDGYGSRDRSLLWDPILGSRDIADLLGDDRFEWTSAYVTDINSAGQIVGYRDNEGFLLTPVPEPDPFLAGDFNENGVVDAADYVVWRHGLGTTYTQMDYNLWRADFGEALSAGLLVGSGTSPAPDTSPPVRIPEPTTSLMLLMAVVALFFPVRRTALV